MCLSKAKKFLIKRRVFELIHTKFDTFSKFSFVIGAQKRLKLQPNCLFAN